MIVKIRQNLNLNHGNEEFIPIIINKIYRNNRHVYEILKNICICDNIKKATVEL